MLFIYPERGGAKEYAVLRDGCQTRRVEESSPRLTSRP